MVMTIEVVQEKIELVKKEIHSLKYQIARYEDELDNESYYRRDYHKEEIINAECDKLANDCAVLEKDLKRLESLLSLKLKRQALNDQKERLEIQYNELENTNNDDLRSTTLIEIYALKQDISYLDSCIKKAEKEETNKNKK